MSIGNRNPPLLIGPNLLQHSSLGLLRRLSVLRPKIYQHLVLQSIINDVVQRKVSFSSSLTLQSFKRLRPTQWLDDEIINYFVEKLRRWSNKRLVCLQSNMGSAYSGYKPRQKVLGLRQWHQVFIPINKGRNHCLEPTLRLNQDKPIGERKYAGLMLALMWVTEVLGSLRGDTVQLANNPCTDWKCRLHVKVHFQPNGHDCGVYMLWSLRDILGTADEYGFSDSGLVVKRLRLAQQILDDHEEI
ncbi:hypothetical protein K435DRAFT_792885 [Dendrothele bispora CBS 962.96]|uniref:Ubiquitin-like protease family profile domain-containing protein n=1 Tax=Dendrothele bispora (strain CBS 962.96) TaxID=1314807 RepID=A0A4S8MHT0_DENBC|nr:hypothetical protein K435DRAFT_792885 [Dendrothele bispora CBS 962.96]